LKYKQISALGVYPNLSFGLTSIPLCFIRATNVLILTFFFPDLYTPVCTKSDNFH
jgi:hypothetical protein